MTYGVLAGTAGARALLVHAETVFEVEDAI